MTWKISANLQQTAEATGHFSTSVQCNCNSDGIQTLFHVKFVFHPINATTNALQGILYSIHFPIKSVVSNQTPIVSRESEIDTIITLIQSCQSSYICTSSFSSLRIYGFQWILSCLFQFLESNSGNHRFLKLLVYVILKRFQIFTFSTWHLILWKMSFTFHWKLILPSSDVYYLFLFKVPSEAYATL